MSNPVILPAAQAEADLLIEDQTYERNLLDQLLIDSRLYRTSKEYSDLLNFTIRLRNMAPFNAMLLQIQKPSLNYAASACDWKIRFNRTVKEKSRPLLIMWPFGPVALVYDLLDTEGPDLPKDAFAFYAKGKIDEARIAGFAVVLGNKQIFTKPYDQGDNDAGFIRRLTRSKDAKAFSTYELGINRNHNAAMAFVTLAHELGHLFLGHLGDDKKLGIQDRSSVPRRLREIEAESVAYIVCHRNGVECRSQKYLNDYVKSGESAEDLDLYAITRAAGHIERLLDLSRSSKLISDGTGKPETTEAPVAATPPPGPPAFRTAIPREELAQLREIAEALHFDDGIKTPEALAVSLNAIGLRALSENMWAGILAIGIDSTVRPDWSAIYANIDNLARSPKTE